METVIRPARLEDAEALWSGCYPEARLEDVRDYLAWSLRQADKGRLLRLVAEMGGQAVGNAQLTVWDQRGEIGSVVVAVAFRRQGVARQLIEALMADAERRGLAELEIRVDPDQPEILAFYERLGFRRAETKKGAEPIVGLRLPL